MLNKDLYQINPEHKRGSAGWTTGKVVMGKTRLMSIIPARVVMERRRIERRYTLPFYCFQRAYARMIDRDGWSPQTWELTVPAV